MNTKKMLPLFVLVPVVVVLGVALGVRTRPMRRERIDAAADVNAFAVDDFGLIPSALRDCDDAGHDAGSDARGELHDAAVVKDLHRVAVFNAALFRVQRIHEHHVRMQIAQVRQVVERRMDAAVPMEPEAL